MDIILFDGDGYKVKIVARPPGHVNKNKLIVVQGGDDKINRLACSSKNVDILLDPHLGKRKDFMHHRNSGLNQVLCKLAKENKVAIGFSLSAILNEKKRSKLLGRMIQNIKLCRKYKVKMVIGSYAKDCWELRNEDDIKALFKVLGMTGSEIKMDYIEKRLDYKRRYIRKGVMLAR